MSHYLNIHTVMKNYYSEEIMKMEGTNFEESKSSINVAEDESNNSVIDDEVEDEIVDEITDEIEHEIGDEVEHEVEDEIDDEVEDEIEDEIEDEVEDKNENENEDHTAAAEHQCDFCEEKSFKNVDDLVNHIIEAH